MKIVITVFFALFLSAGCNSSQNAGYKDADVPEFKKMMTQDNVVILDVRTPEETAEGIIKGAIEIDYQAEGFDAKIDKLDTSKTYLVYCRSGGRSGRTAKKMVSKGFKNVVNLKGGYLDWSK